MVRFISGGERQKTNINISNVNTYLVWIDLFIQAKHVLHLKYFKNETTVGMRIV